MKTILIALAFVAFTSAYPTTDDPIEEGCKFCLEGSKIMLEKIRTQKVIGDLDYFNQTAILNGYCQAQNDVEECLGLVNTWWQTIKDIIFAERVANDLCHRQNDACPENDLERTWDCKACERRIMDTAALSVSYVGRDFFTGLLTGPAFCENPAYFKVQDQTVCKIYVQSNIRLIGQILGSYGWHHQNFCHHVFFGICKPCEPNGATC